MAHAAATAGAEVEVVDFPTRLLKLEQCAGGNELDVVRVGDYGEGGFFYDPGRIFFHRR